MPLNEKLLIQRIRRAAAHNGQERMVGIGDDCAVLPLPAGREVLVTTDFSLEDVHFRRIWHPARSVGHRCVARGLSDIAAMGGVPHAAFLSLAAPSSLSQRWIDEFIRGLLQLANRYGVQLAGGDTAQSLRGVLADIVVLGSAPKGQAIRRSGAKPGDLLYVTGTLGSSVAVLNELRKGKKLRPHSYPRHFYPEPRITVGRYLRERKLATAMIDISDGLSTDLAHICDESKAGAVVYASTLPVVERENALTLALHGGEDYELLFAARPESRIPREILGVPVTRIGEVIPGKQVRLAKANGRTEILRPRGWQHFS